MLLPDPARALRASHDLLAEGGRIALAVWGPPEHNRWMTAITDAVMAAVGAPPPEPGTPGPFALGDPARLRELVTGAGFGDVAVDEVAGEMRHDSVDAWWEDSTEGKGPLSAVMRSLDPEQLAAVRERALPAAERYVGEDGAVRFPASLVVARGSACAP